MNDPLIPLITALADDELVLGHRHSEWTGFAPHLEEDVAFSSIAQDEIGHAAAYYSLLAELTGDDPDRLSLGRDPHEYRNAVLCERPNRDWAYSLVRHWLYDTADSVRLEALQHSEHPGLRALATKMSREERYHLIHANAWMRRVAEGPVEGRSRLIRSLAWALAESLALFEPLELEEDALASGWLPRPSAELQRDYLRRATLELEELGLPAEIHHDLDESAEFVASSSGELIAEAAAREPADSRSGFGGRRGVHSEEFKALWDEMTSTYRHHPGATW